MKKPSKTDKPTPQNSILRRPDQAVLGAMVLVLIVALAGYWFARGGASGRLIEIDRAPDQHAQFQLDINQADWPELAELPGIGETLAKRIVDSRAESGPFVDHDDLRRVRGIGGKTLDRIKPYLRTVPGSNVAKQ